MWIIPAAFAGSVIREGFGKLYADQSNAKGQTFAWPFAFFRFGKIRESQFTP
jgi:hypothetical protein